MNEECAALGLTHTHFVEPSGYDEHNLTTARELAAFCCEYIKRFPQSVEEFHSAPSIKYPMEKNLPSWLKSKGDSTAIYQRNTNPLLGVMEGCDGIKTGFIYEGGNVDELCAYIERFLRMDNRDRQKMGLLGRKHVRKNFSRDIVIDAYLTKIKEILG